MTRFVSDPGSNEGAIYAVADLANQIGQGAILAKSGSGSITLTVAQLINGLISVSGSPGAFNVTTPTAAEIVAALKNAQAGSKFEFHIVNNGDNTATIVAGSGVTLLGTTACATVKSQIYRGFVTVATLGSEAVTLVGILKAAS